MLQSPICTELYPIQILQQWMPTCQIVVRNFLGSWRSDRTNKIMKRDLGYWTETHKWKLGIDNMETIQNYWTKAQSCKGPTTQVAGLVLEIAPLEWFFHSCNEQQRELHTRGLPSQVHNIKEQLVKKNLLEKMYLPQVECSISFRQMWQSESGTALACPLQALNFKCSDTLDLSF